MLARLRVPTQKRAPWHQWEHRPLCQRHPKIIPSRFITQGRRSRWRTRNDRSGVGPVTFRASMRHLVMEHRLSFRGPATLTSDDSDSEGVAKPPSVIDFLREAPPGNSVCTLHPGADRRTSPAERWGGSRALIWPLRGRDEVLRSRAIGCATSGCTWCAPSGSHRFVMDARFSNTLSGCRVAESTVGHGRPDAAARATAAAAKPPDGARSGLRDRPRGTGE